MTEENGVTLMLTISPSVDVADDVASLEVKRDSVDVSTLRSLSTPKRVELLAEVIDSEPASISELANMLDRSYPRVHDDVTLLQDHGLLSLESGSSRGSKPVFNSKISQFVAPEKRSLDGLGTDLVEGIPGEQSENTEETHSQVRPDQETREHQETLSEWCSKAKDLEGVSDEYQRGDVVWVENGPNHGRALALLSHSLPATADRVAGVELTLDVENADSPDLIDVEDWKVGGPGTMVAARPWVVENVHPDGIEKRVGALSHGVTNDLSVRMQVFLGPARR